MVRRHFLVRLTVALGALIAGVLAVPGLAMLVAPLRRKRSVGAFVRLVAFADLPDGRPMRLAVRQTVIDGWTRYPARHLGSVWLLRHGDTRVQAFSGTCPHAGCNINFDETTKHFACPCHHAFFADSGARTAGPSKRGLDPLEVKVEDGSVWVRWQTFKLGVVDRVPR